MDIVQSFLDLALVGGSEWVLWLLLALSILSIALIFERIYFYSKLKIDLAEFNHQLTDCVVKKDREGLEKICQNRDALQCRMVLRGLENFERGPEAMEQTMRGFLTAEKTNLDRGLVVLGTLGNNAPFIGLFGTVIGIIMAFHSLGQNASGGAEAVMAGISEALVATAVGLMVAIPAVIAYNLFQRVVKGHIASSEAIADQVTTSFRT